MTTHAEKRVVPYTAAQMYDLIADIEKYPEFLPWCAAVRLRSTAIKPAGTQIDADMIISFKVFRERFGSRVQLRPDAQEIDVSYLDGPFKHMENRWGFRDLGNGSCEIDFFVDFEFKSRTLQALIGVVFTEAMRRVVGAFETRAKVLYSGIA